MRRGRILKTPRASPAKMPKASSTETPKASRRVRNGEGVSFPQPTNRSGERHELRRPFLAFLTVTERFQFQCLPQFYDLKADIS